MEVIHSSFPAHLRCVALSAALLAAAAAPAADVAADRLQEQRVQKVKVTPPPRPAVRTVIEPGEPEREKTKKTHGHRHPRQKDNFEPTREAAAK